MIFKLFIILYDKTNINNHPEPSVEVSEAPNDTIISERNITYIVLEFAYVYESSLLKINSMGRTFVVSIPVIVSSFFLSISKFTVYKAFPLHLISFHRQNPESKSIYFFFVVIYAAVIPRHVDIVTS